MSFYLTNDRATAYGLPVGNRDVFLVNRIPTPLLNNGSVNMGQYLITSTIGRIGSSNPMHLKGSTWLARWLQYLDMYHGSSESSEGIASIASSSLGLSSVRVMVANGIHDQEFVYLDEYDLFEMFRGCERVISLAPGLLAFVEGGQLYLFTRDEESVSIIRMSNLNVIIDLDAMLLKGEPIPEIVTEPIPATKKERKPRTRKPKVAESQPVSEPTTTGSQIEPLEMEVELRMDRTPVREEQ